MPIRSEMLRRLTAEPTGKERTDQTQQVAKGGNPLGNDPGNDPADQANSHPGADGDEIALAHALGVLAPDANVEVFETDMAVDHASTDNLVVSQPEDRQKLRNGDTPLEWQFHKQPSS